MKAVVLEKKGKYAAVLKEDGSIEKIKSKREVGEEIELSESTSRITSFRRYGAIAAAAAIVLMAGMGGYAYATPASYVSVDVNPSLEFALNRFDRVLSVTALNDDAKTIAEQYEKEAPHHADLSEAMEITTELLYEASFLDDDTENEILIDAVSKNDTKSQSLLETASLAVKDAEEKLGNNAKISTCISTQEDRKKAMDEGLSTGLYMKKMNNESKETSEPLEEKSQTENAPPSNFDNGSFEDAAPKPSDMQEDTAPPDALNGNQEAAPSINNDTQQPPPQQEQEHQ